MRRFKVKITYHENYSNIIKRVPWKWTFPTHSVLPTDLRDSPTLCVWRLCLCVSQANTGLIQTRAAQETPSKSSATLQQEGRRASTPIKNLRGYESKHQWLLHKCRCGAEIHNAVNSLPFPSRSEYPTGPRRVLVHGSVNSNGGKLWVHFDLIFFTQLFPFQLLLPSQHSCIFSSDSYFSICGGLSLSELSSPPITLLRFVSLVLSPFHCFNSICIQSPALVFSFTLAALLNAAELRRRGGKLHQRGADDLPQAAELRRSAELHLYLPSVGGLVRLQGWQLWQGTALPGLQRWGDVLRQ